MNGKKTIPALADSFKNKFEVLFFSAGLVIEVGGVMSILHRFVLRRGEGGMKLFLFFPFCVHIPHMYCIYVSVSRQPSS